MLVRLAKALMVYGAAVFIFQNRYKIMNWLLGNKKLRQWAVQFSMRIPSVRKLFMQSAFRQSTTN